MREFRTMANNAMSVVHVRARSAKHAELALPAEKSDTEEVLGFRD